MDNNLSNDTRLDWHSAFFAALKAELVDYLDILQFEQEHPLNEQPLRIDAVVIKAPPNAKIEKNFARNFKGHNIFEYKSPEDSLTVSDYIKAIGYACLYQAIESVDYTDITITFVCTMKPESVLAHLRDDIAGRYEVTERQPGIYEISGEKFPVQILESKLLPPEENAWLVSLKENAEAAALEAAAKQNPATGEKVNLGAFWYVVSKANKKKMEVSKEMLDYFKATYPYNEEEWLQALKKTGVTQKIFNQGVDSTLAVMKGLQKNIPPAKLSADYGIPLESVERIKEEVCG